MTKTICISIHPIYCHLIFILLTKLYELRKKWPEGVEKVYVYASKKKGAEGIKNGFVIGCFEVGGVYNDEPNLLWIYLNNQITPFEQRPFGIDKHSYYEYSPSFAVQIKNPILFQKPKTLADIGLKSAHQGYVFVKK